MGPGVVGGPAVVVGGGGVGGTVIFQSGAGPRVGRIPKLIDGRPGKPGSGLAGASGNGGGGPGRGGGGGGPGIGGCAGAGIVVVGGGVTHAAAAPAPHLLPVNDPWQLQPRGMPCCLPNQLKKPFLAILRWRPAAAAVWCKELLLIKNSEAALVVQNINAKQHPRMRRANVAESRAMDEPFVCVTSLRYRIA